jgi:signal transduction histidine kinase
LSDGNLLQVGLSSSERNGFLENFFNFILLGLLFVVILGFVGGAFLAFRWLRPVKHLSATIRAIAETGQISARVPSRGSGDELDELGALFNQMLGRIDTLIQGMREALDNVAHDLKTPMTRLRGVAEHALQSADKHQVCQEALADCLEESEQVVTMLKTLMDISEAETGVMRLNIEKIHLAELIDSVCEVYRYVAEEKNIQVINSVSAEIEIDADRMRLKQVVANLLDNAIKYTPKNGEIHIDASVSKEAITISVKDNGVGIPAHEIDKIWDRLHRGDDSRSQEGLGLGLSLVKAVVVSHKGRVGVSSQPGHGSTFSVSFPLLHVFSTGNNITHS